MQKAVASSGVPHRNSELQGRSLTPSRNSHGLKDRGVYIQLSGLFQGYSSQRSLLPAGTFLGSLSSLQLGRSQGTSIPCYRQNLTRWCLERDGKPQVPGHRLGRSSKPEQGVHSARDCHIADRVTSLGVSQSRGVPSLGSRQVQDLPKSIQLGD